MNSRECKKCGHVFSGSHCDACARARVKKWVIENKDRKRAADAAYHEKNRDKILVYQKQYREKNRKVFAEQYQSKAAVHRERAKAYRLSNPEKCKKAQANWRKNNPEKLRIYCTNRRKRTVGKLSQGIVKKLMALQKGKCACCKRPLGSDFHLDHIMPLVLGGLNVDSNVQLLRGKCNKEKHAKHPIDFMQSRGFLL